MKNFSKLKLLAIAIFLVGAAMWVATPGMIASSAGIVDDASSPRSLYTQNCASCHGADGKAQTRLGRKYDADDISGGVGAATTVHIVTNGKGKMPSFKKRLTKAQIAQIASYVSSL